MNNLKNKINNLHTEIRALSLDEFYKIKSNLSDLVKTYQSQSNDLDKALKEKNMQELKIKEVKLLSATNYISPEYPSMGVAGENGSCYFESEAQAKELFSLIYKTYYFAPKLKWEGIGHYIIIPDYKYDHDGDTVYTDIYQKEVL